MFGMSSYEKVYMMRKSFTHVDTLFKWHLICLFSPSIQEPSDYSCLEGPGWTLPTLLQSPHARSCQRGPEVDITPSPTQTEPLQSTQRLVL